MTTTTVPVRDKRPARRRKLPPRARKNLLLVHVVLSVGWLGVDLAMLALGVAGLNATDAVAQQAAYRSLQTIGSAVLPFVAVGALVSGIVISVLTPWGLLKHWWVTVKLVLTVAAIGLSAFVLNAEIDATVTVLDGQTGLVDLGRTAKTLVIAPSVAFMVYLAATILSIFKPWGRVRRP